MRGPSYERERGGQRSATPSLPFLRLKAVLTALNWGFYSKPYRPPTIIPTKDSSYTALNRDYDLEPIDLL